MIRLSRLLVLLALLLTGCDASPWSTSFSPSGESAPPLEAGSAVALREVPWERLQETLNELHRERIESDIHPDEWSVERKEAAKARLLIGLQVSIDPARITVLGRSEFRSTRQVAPDDGGLEAQARKVGATMVVWSRTYLGRREITTQEPVNQYTTVWRPYRDRRGRWRHESVTEQSTIWVPIQVQADEHAWTAYFLRDAAAASRDASASTRPMSSPAR